MTCVFNEISIIRNYYLRIFGNFFMLKQMCKFDIFYISYNFDYLFLNFGRVSF